MNTQGPSVTRSSSPHSLPHARISPSRRAEQAEPWAVAAAAAAHSLGSCSNPGPSPRRNLNNAMQQRRVVTSWKSVRKFCILYAHTPSLSPSLPPPPLPSLTSSRRASWWCVSSSSCAGRPIVTSPTPRRLSSTCSPRCTSGRGSAAKGAPSSTACESSPGRAQSHTPTLVQFSLFSLFWRRSEKKRMKIKG